MVFFRELNSYLFIERKPLRRVRRVLWVVTIHSTGFWWLDKMAA